MPQLNTMYTGSGPYSSGYADQTYRPRRGRAVPYGHYSRTNGPNGVTETETEPIAPMSLAQPQQAPQPPSGQGLASRSWRDNANGAGVIQPGMVHNTGTIPGFATPAQTVPFQSAAQLPSSGGAGAPASSPTPLYNKNQHSLLEKQYTRAHQEYMDAAKAHKDYAIDDDAFAAAGAKRDAAQKTLTDYEQQFLPKPNAGTTTGSGMAVPFHPMGSGGTAPAAAPVPGVAPTAAAPAAPAAQPPSPDYVRRGPNLAPEAPLSKSDRDQRVKAMYDAAGAGFQRQNQQIEDTPTAKPGDADRLGTLKTAAAAGAGGATQRNALARGKQMAGDTAGVAKMQQDEGQLRADRSAVQGEIGDIETRQKASTPAAVAGRKGQLAQNDASLDAIRQREGQFDNGDYSLQQPLVPYSGSVAGSNGTPPAPAAPAAPTPYTPQQPAAPQAPPPQPVQMAAQAKAAGAVVKGPRAGGQSAVVQPHAPAATQPAKQASGSFLSAGATSGATGPDASINSLPAEAHAAVQKAGGAVNPDGTATIRGAPYVRGTDPKTGKPGWVKAG